MSAWRELRNARPAQLGNASFQVESDSAEFGRKTVLHTYPLRDKPFVEDLGRATRQFSIEAYLIGDDCYAQRDALIAVLESKGPHKLVHPSYGEMSVSIVQRARVDYTTREGGMVRVSFTCVEAGEISFPKASAATGEAVAEAANEALVAVEEEFTEAFEVASIPAFVPDAAIDLVDGFVDTVTDIAETIETVADAIPEFLASLNEISIAVSTLIQSPVVLAGKLLDAISQFNVITTRPQTSLDILKDLFGYGDDLPEVVANTPSRTQQKANQDVFTTLIKRVAIIEAVRASASIKFDSYDKAIETRGELIEAIDAQADAAEDDATYYALIALKTAMINDITERGANLARIVRRSLPVSIPSLTLSYDLYGDIANEPDLLSRNAIRDPLLLPSGEELEVLADV